MDEEKREQFDLAQELREFGRQLQEALRVAREHPQTREIEHQVSKAVADLGTELDRALKQAQTNEHIAKVGEQVKQTAQAIKASGAKEDVERGLAAGLRALNEQIARAIAEAEKSSKPKDQGQ